MKTIIAGSRWIEDYDLVIRIINSCYIMTEITEVVSGQAPGVDSLGEMWAIENDIPIKPFPANWEDLSQPNAIIRTNKWGQKYDAYAGPRRNKKMAEYADALILIWDGKSDGSYDMKSWAFKYELKICEYIVKQDLKFENITKITFNLK